MKKKRPNILLLMTDQHRFDLAGFAGNPVVRTPRLDHLAQNGVVFTNAYTPSPVCVAARQCMSAGQLPKTCDCIGMNEVDLPPGHMTFARRFSQYGYATVCSGKLHIVGEDQMQGWITRIATLNDIEVHQSHIPGLVEPYVKKERVGWDWSKELRTAGPGVNLWAERDRFSVDGALQYIDMFFNGTWYDRHTPDRPLLLKLSLSVPHYPYQCDPDRFRYYINRVAPYVDERSDHPGMQFGKIDPPVTEREHRRGTAAYYGLVEQADDAFGRVLDALEQAGQDLDDWIIVFTSDHGDMLGEHGLWHKVVFYEGSVRVPLMIRAPKQFAGGLKVDENVTLCDLFATLCDLCDIPVPENLDSRSLVPLMQGEAPASWQNEAVSVITKAPNVMIKRDHLKYMYYGEDTPELLFDLERDPGERRSFIDDPGYTEQLVCFRRRLAELGFGPKADAGYVNAGYNRGPG